MSIPYMKISGTGNDFIIVDNRENIMVGFDSATFIRRVCRRRQAVGADGLILVEKSNRQAVQMRLYNCDGTEAEMSGNGARAFASFVHTKGIVKENHFLFETRGGDVEAWVDGKMIRLRFDAAKFIRLNQALTVDGVDYTMHAIEIQGTPHGVIFWENLDDTPASTILDLGRKFRYHPFFSRGANINFTEVLDEHTLRVRTYERGVEDETLSCGTGSTGAAVMGFLLGKVKPPVRIKTSSGGWLEVSWPGRDVRTSNLFFSGEVRHIMEGFILPDAYGS